MKQICRKLTSFALAALLLLGALPAVSTRAEESSTAASDSTSVVRASFANNEINANGRLNDGGWSLSTRAGEEALLGAQWNMENLYFAVYTPQKEDVTVTLNGTEITKSNAKLKTYTVRSTGKTTLELAVAHTVIGTVVKDYGTEISAEVKIGNTVWTGKIVLTSTVWYAVDNPSGISTHAGIRTGGNMIVHEVSTPTQNQGIASISSGYKFFDKYSETGANPPAITSRLFYQGEKYASLGDRTTPSVVGFTFCANSMPVYRLGTDNDFFPYITTSGFNWYMSSVSPAYEVLPYVSMGIINTDIGLVFVVREADRDMTYILNKFEGDKFYIETAWMPDGSLTLAIDGEQVATFPNVEMSRWDLSENTIIFQLLRSNQSAKSEDDTFDIDITGLCFGTHYGETMLEPIDFNTIRGSGNEQYYVVNDLSLPSTVTNVHFTNPVAIEWESSNPDVIDPKTGKVTRPEKSTLVTLTATAPSIGSSAEIEVYVIGTVLQDDVLVVKNDYATYSGAGIALELPVFTFDENNNSIIRDQKEAKTVNVIKLTDSDASCRLNESNLTIWTSDDNKTYTMLDSFKLLRDGQYTYLYDFEATARYIKVHFTLHAPTDADFKAPIENMIEVYHEDIFGDAGAAFATQSAVEVSNKTDSDMMDTVATVSPTDAGVLSLADNYADVRFLLGDELLYHFFDGKNFLVRVPDIAAGESVPLTVLSGNADAKDIANHEPIYEVSYGYRETSTDMHPNGIKLNNDMYMGFVSQGTKDTVFYYYVTGDEGRTMSNWRPATGSYNIVCAVHGNGYDDTTGRIFVHGFTSASGTFDGNYVGSIMYSDDGGRLWTQATINYELEGDCFSYSYDDIIKVSSYDGEDGPNVDFVLITSRDSKAMKEYYGNNYSHSEMTSLYSTDGGLTWTMSGDGVRFFGGDDTVHIREHGLCECVCMETKDGVLVAYARCQYENVNHLGYAVSYDFGKTWEGDAQLSNVYSTNTQPELFKMGEYEFLLWAGNNVYGGGSYRRYPLNVAISYDGLMTFRDIQDIFLKTDYQGMVNGTCINFMNPTLTVYGDDLYLGAASDDTMAGQDYRTVRIGNFLDYFFRTKGAYDSFENSTTEYEGWSTTGGQVEASAAQATDGTKSMMFTPGSAAVRSLPEIKDGKVAFDLYIEDVMKANLELELETSHGPHYGTAAPIALKLYQDQLTPLGGDVIMNAVKNGWNRFEFDLSLTDDTPSATLSINGGKAVALPVNAEIGDYICYVHIVCQGELTYYLDSFLAEDMDGTAYPTVAAASVSDIGNGENTTPDQTDTSPASDEQDTSADTSATGTPGTDSGISAIVWIGIGTVVVIGAIVAIILLKKKKSA